MLKLNQKETQSKMLMRGALETRPHVSQLADEIQQQGSHRMAVEMTYWYN